jgi:hypothetical protein
MGTTLTGTTPQDTYDSLIKVTDNGPLTGSLKKLTDGLGNDSSLSLSTTAASLSGTLAVTGNATFDTSVLVVDAANNRVGIGTASPTAGYSLSVVGAFGAAVGGAYVEVGEFDRSLMILNHTNASVNANLFQVQKSGTGVLTVNPAGNVGIGTSAPTNLGASVTSLDVAGTAGGGLTTRGTTVTGEVIALDAAGGLYISTKTTHPMIFRTADVERMRILSGGNVGIGTSAPTEPLHVVGDARVTNLGVNFAAQADARIFVYDDSANSGLVIQQDGASGIIAKFNGSSGATKVRIDADGLKFGADTAAANALDDYEEGDWTPTILFGGAAVGVTYTSQVGKYTKIGRQVTVSCHLVLSSKGSSTGAATMGGLPFTIPNNLPNLSGAALRIENITFANIVQGYGVINSTTIGFEEVTLLGAVTSITDADFSNTSGVIIGFSYSV